MTGNVTGNVTGNLFGNADTATLAATATNALALGGLAPSAYAVLGNAANFSTVSGNGAGLTNLTATNLTGVVLAANLPTDVVYNDKNNTFNIRFCAPETGS